MNESVLHLTRAAIRGTAAVTLALVLLVPAGYFWSGYQQVAEKLDIELALDRVQLNQIVNRDPLLWRFKEERLQAVLDTNGFVGPSLEQRRVVDLTGQAAAHSGQPPPLPVLTRSASLLDSGREVGRLALATTLRPLWQRTLSLATALLLLAGAVLWGLRRLTGELADTEQALMLSQDTIACAVTPMVIVSATAADCPIEYVNAAFERLTGYTLDEVRGQNCRFLQGAERDQPALAAVRLALAEQREGQALLRNVRKDGTAFWNELHIRPVTAPDGGVRQYIGELLDVTERLQAAELLHFQSAHDPLTGLPNRRQLNERLEEAIADSNRNDRPLAVAHIDLDGFKFINDSCGHAAGDRVLAKVAWRIAQLVDSMHTLLRVGGDEFVLLLGGCSGEASYTLLLQIAQVVAEPIVLDQHTFHLTCSVGVAVYPLDGADVETLLRNADVAMARTKEGRRGGIQFYTQTMHERVRWRLEWETDLRHAIEQAQLSLHYQPQVDLRSGAIVGLEALARWQHPQRGSVPPVQFIGLAEELHLIGALSHWVLTTACRQIRCWLDAGLLPGPVAINVSAQQFASPDFAQQVAAALVDGGVEPCWLELEITESLSMHDPEGAERILQGLREMGVGLAIDDFGTGYSNLGYLKRLPVQRLKIDRCFVHEIAHVQQDRVICQAVIEVAHGLGLEVVAEGVESAAQLHVLAELGCDSYQGYHFSRPLAVDACTELLRQRKAPAAGPSIVAPQDKNLGA